MGWWILLGILALLLLLPFGASIFYDANGVRVLVIVGPVRFTVFPKKKKEKEEPAKPAQNSEAKEAEPAKTEKTPLPEAPKPPEPAEPQKEEPGGSLTDFLPLVELALKFVGEFFHKTLHIDTLYLKLTMAGDDPADLAINYGRAWTAMGNLWPYLDRMFTIKKRDIQIQCDFTAIQPLVNARVDITLTLARLLGLVLNYGLRILIKFLQIKNKQGKSEVTSQTNKGGANS